MEWWPGSDALFCSLLLLCLFLCVLAPWREVLPLPLRPTSQAGTEVVCAQPRTARAAPEASMNSDATIATLNSLLRGELAAVETYRQALEKVEADDAGKAASLRSLEAEHREAARQLRDQVVRLGGTPEAGSGAWGAFARAVAGVARMFGNGAA